MVPVRVERERGRGREGEREREREREGNCMVPVRVILYEIFFVSSIQYGYVWLNYGYYLSPVCIANIINLAGFRQAGSQPAAVQC
jgi:hypothetical protein